MSNKLYILGTRDITINKTGRQETQTCEIYIADFLTEEDNKLIVNSLSPFVELCTKLRSKFNYKIPIFIWELEENQYKPEMIDKENSYCSSDSVYNYENPNPNDIVGYKENFIENVISNIYKDIEDLLDNDYDIKWVIK